MSRRVLIVEDDDETREFLSKGFTEEGFAVESAADGREGLFHATDGGFDAVVLDRMLPGLDGLIVAFCFSSVISVPSVVNKHLILQG